MTKLELEKLANEYLRHAIWFIREGRGEFEGVQRVLAERLEAVAVTPKEPPSVMTDGELAEHLLHSVQDVPAVRHDSDGAENRVLEIVCAGGTDAWRLLCAIVRAAPHEQELLGYIGAGIFETWLADDSLEAVSEEFSELWFNEPKWHEVVYASWEHPPALLRLLAQFSSSD